LFQIVNRLEIVQDELPKNSFPPSLSCRAEFGTGFLPPETGVPKGPEVDISAQRAEIGDHHTREMAAKTAFLFASYQLRVSEDWVVADAAKRNRSPTLIRLLTGKRTGNFPDF
jgi:hypothetical protein